MLAYHFLPARVATEVTILLHNDRMNFFFFFLGNLMVLRQDARTLSCRVNLLINYRQLQNICDQYENICPTGPLLFHGDFRS